MAELGLPMDVLIEVLVLLPVKSLLKFRCVSETWRDLISNPTFIDRHLKCDRKQSIVLLNRIIHHGIPPQNEEGQIFSFQDLDFPELLVSPNLSIPILNERNSYIPICGPCNGLICISLEENAYLCNPALREFKLLPPLKFPEGNPCLRIGNGFGFDRIGGIYKVVQIWEWSTNSDTLYGSEEEYLIVMDCIRVYLYNSASNSWKQIDAKLPYINNNPGVGLFLNGTIHWYITTSPDDCPCILCFDTSAESFRLLDFDDNFHPPDARDPTLLVLDGSLAMVFCVYYSPYLYPNEFDIWVMKKYGMVESWTKQSVIGTCYISRPILFLKNE